MVALETYDASPALFPRPAPGAGFRVSGDPVDLHRLPRRVRPCGSVHLPQRSAAQRQSGVRLCGIPDARRGSEGVREKDARKDAKKGARKESRSPAANSGTSWWRWPFAGSAPRLVGVWQMPWTAGRARTCSPRRATSSSPARRQRSSSTGCPPDPHARREWAIAWPFPACPRRRLRLLCGGRSSGPAERR